MILVTGGTGHIGSHASVALAAVSHELVVLDNGRDLAGMCADAWGWQQHDGERRFS